VEGELVFVMMNSAALNCGASGRSREDSCASACEHVLSVFLWYVVKLSMVILRGDLVSLCHVGLLECNKQLKGELGLQTNCEISVGQMSRPSRRPAEIV